MAYTNNYSNAYRSQYRPQYQSSWQTQDNRKASVNNVLRYLVMSDDGDGKFTRQEVKIAAKLAAEMGDKASAEAIGTFTEGGRYGTGLMPDTDGNGATSIHEILDLANWDGDRSTISPNDFHRAFPGQTKAGGNYFNPYQSGGPSNGGGGGSNQAQQLIQLLLKLLLSVGGY